MIQACLLSNFIHEDRENSLIAAKACTTHAGECWGPQDVGHGVVATGRGALQLRSLIACAAGSHLFAFPAGH